jgi:ATP phosphoribosyltransferase
VPIKLALPKGRLLRKTASLLQKAGWRLDEYHSEMGFYRPRSEKYPDMLIRVFHEKDIPIQIALGNYDIGICCRDWIEELMVKYPTSELVKVRDLGYGGGSLYMAAATPNSGKSGNGLVRIAGEYPNLAESYALKQRLDRFSVLSLWGAAEVYPPENADLVLLSAKDAGELAEFGMVALGRVLDYSAFLIANQKSLESKNLREIIDSIGENVAETPEKIHSEETLRKRDAVRISGRGGVGKDTVRLALPDGHQQKPTVEFLQKAGITVVDYPSTTGNRRPEIDIDGVSVKVIRPQDMPQQVANGNFDLAITGQDWLEEHLRQFPSSPVRELVKLGFSRVRLVAVVHQDLVVDDADELSRYFSGNGKPLRVASEYVNLADCYARENHLGHYLVIPTWGATEAFLPDDADLLIENTETGRTIARHNLKIIDTLFVSTSCIIGNTSAGRDPKKQKTINGMLERMKKAAGETS